METSSNSGSANVEETLNDSRTEAMEKKLLQEIRQLKYIIEQCESKLDTSYFKDVHTTKQPNESTIQRFYKIPDVQTKLRNDLYRFAGLHCVKYKRDEIVFNFTSTKERQKCDTYALQVLIDNRKGKLGKWVMPMSIDMHHMVTKIPIDKLKNLTGFLKSCKHNVNCYATRQEQFLSLKEYISNMRNCTLQSNMGFTQVNLELYGVHDIHNDKYIDLIVYLLYHSDGARPYKIEIDRIHKDKLDNEMLQKLKAWVKELKMSDLLTAFSIMADNDSTFTWTRVDGTESPLEFNNISSSDEEGFLAEMQSDRKKSLRKAERKRKLQKKWKERKKRKGFRNNASSEDDSDTSHPTTKELRSESSQDLMKKKRTEETVLFSGQRKKIDGKLQEISEETTPMNKSKTKLKQTKLNFRLKQTTNSKSTSQSPLFQSKQHAKYNSKKQTSAKLFTSTPLHRRNINNDTLPSTSSLDITDIEYLSKPTAKKLNK